MGQKHKVREWQKNKSTIKIDAPLLADMFKTDLAFSQVCMLVLAVNIPGRGWRLSLELQGLICSSNTA